MVEEYGLTLSILRYTKEPGWAQTKPMILTQRFINRGDQYQTGKERQPRQRNSQSTSTKSWHWTRNLWNFLSSSSIDRREHSHCEDTCRWSIADRKSISTVNCVETKQLFYIYMNGFSGFFIIGRFFVERCWSLHSVLPLEAICDR